MSGEDHCCFCDAFGMKVTIRRPAPNSCTCRSWPGKAGTFPVPALTQVNVRRIGYAFFCLGILATLGLFAAMAVSQELRYPGANWCNGWEQNCKYLTVETGGIGVMNSFDKAYMAMMLGTLIFNILGLIGVGREKRSILRVVGVLLVLFFVAQVTLSGIHGNMLKYGKPDVVTFPRQVYDQGRESMYYNLRIISPDRDTWDNMQKVLKCCGVISYTDWQKYHSYIPRSCDCDEMRFIYNRASCVKVNLKGNVTKSVFDTGCLGKLFNDGKWIYASRQEMLWKAGLGLAFAQWLPMLFALVMGFRKESREVAYKDLEPPAYKHNLDDCKAVVVNKQPVVTQEGDAKPNGGSAH